MIRAVVAVVLVAALAGTASGAPAFDDAHVADLVAGPADLGLEVSYRVEGAFPGAVEERLHSGFEIVYEHRVELVAERAWWANRTREVAAFETAATYDSLTHRYSLELRAHDGSSGGPASERRVTDSVDEVRRFLTEVRGLRVAVPSELAGQERLELRVSCRLGRRWLLWMFPTSWVASGRLEVGS